MTRIRLLIEYDGAPFAGWQRQPDQPSVQGALEEAAGKIAGEPVIIQGAGRTDAGVHATGQVAHFDLAREIEEQTIADALNFHLRPAPVAVLEAKYTGDDFHARFDAVRRHYRYVIINRRADLTLERGRVWRVPSRLDTDAMNQAAQSLIGRHDFTTFRDQLCQAKEPVRTLDTLDIARYGERIEITCSARSFLHKQVRSMVGSLVDVGRGHRPVDWVAQALAARDRKACGPVAPPDGLFLERVDYDTAPNRNP